MDKPKLITNQKCSIFFILFLLTMLSVGCETTKGMAYGVGSTAEGAASDTKNLWQMILKVDNWIRENLW